MKASDSTTFAKVEQHLRAATDSYLATGVAIIEDSWDKIHNGSEDTTEARKKYRREYLAVTSGTFVRAYLRAVGKEFKRPFVVARVGATVTRLTMPNSKRMEPCLANFLLLPCAKSMYGRDVPDTPAYYYIRSTVFTVTFRGSTGLDMFGEFIHRCRTELDYKKALGTA